MFAAAPSCVNADLAVLWNLPVWLPGDFSRVGDGLNIACFGQRLLGEHGDQQLVDENGEEDDIADQLQEAEPACRYASVCSDKIRCRWKRQWSNSRPVRIELC